MSLATGTKYRITFKNKRHNLQRQRRPYTVCNMLKQKLHHFCSRSSLMMAQSRAESTRDTCNYGQYINQFPQNTIKVIREFERIQKKICRHKMSIMFNEICINEEMLPKYMYIPCIHVCIHVYMYTCIYIYVHM